MGRSTSPVTVHDKTIDWLVNRLVPNHDMVARNVEYCRRGLVGEVDVLTYDRDSDRYIFWEIKTTYGKKQYTKARHQFERYCQAHPSRHVQGVMVTPSRIRRLYS